MNLNVQVISEDTVKPFSPTADGLRHRLSFLDQLTPSHYNHLVYFYPKICDTEADKITISDRLKHSVSNALTYFYPLAGRMTEDQLFVDCNDEGILFVGVRVKCQLSDVLNNLVPEELNKLLPFQVHSVNEVLAGIQLNVFECGGVAIGVCISHKIGDALSFFSFVKTWAALARGETELVAVPDFESASLFPPQDVSGFKQRINPANKEHVMTKRFVFRATEVEQIRRKYSENSNQTRPTRVEALSAFIWERLVTAKGAKSRLGTLFTITHLVNIRSRMEPPLPESSFGNLYSLALTILSMDGDIVSQIRDSIKAVNSEYVKKIRDGYNHFDKYYELEARYGKAAIVPFGVTSLCRFPRYDADFGWGTPVWAGSGDLGINNLAVFMDAVNGDGIEAWITLDKEDMAKFGSDEGMLAYVIAPKSL